MHQFLIQLHTLTDKLLPYAIMILAVDFIIHFFYPIFHLKFNIYFIILQIFGLSIFAFDLIFKFYRASNWPEFLKSSWFDIVALFPFFIVFRVFEAIGLVGELSSAMNNTQGAVGRGREVERLVHFERFIEPIFKSPRFLKILHFYNKP
ncbi:MAG: hypothetical protein LAT82_00940 [Nanoarchaeota archaeon]|nr:hypothetical protein [Nanoarchaeota archaeon]